MDSMIELNSILVKIHVVPSYRLNVAYICDNYLDGPTELFSDLYLGKFADISIKHPFRAGKRKCAA